MKKILFTALLVLSGTGIRAASSADAYEYPYLTFQNADGTTESIAVESLTLTVSDGQLIARNEAVGITLTLSQLSKMYFNTTPSSTGISAVSAGSAVGGVEVFSVCGTSLGRFGSLGQAQATLARGIYVVKTDEGTQKIAIR